MSDLAVGRIRPGTKVGRLTVVELRGRRPSAKVDCECECGAPVVRGLNNLQSALSEQRNSACKSCQRADRKKTSIVSAGALRRSE